MAGPTVVMPKGYKATAATPKFTAVKRGTVVETCTPAVGGDLVLGICQEEITAGDATNGRVANILLEGQSFAIASAAIAIGDKVKVTTAGKMVTTTTTNDIYCGIAETAAAADGDWFVITLTPAAKL